MRGGNRILVAGTLSAQTPAPTPAELPLSLTRMIDAERAFAARALVVGWKQAFLEYFADEAIGFDDGREPALHERLVVGQHAGRVGPEGDHERAGDPRRCTTCY